MENSKIFNADAYNLSSILTSFNLMPDMDMEQHKLVLGETLPRFTAFAEMAVLRRPRHANLPNNPNDGNRWERRTLIIPRFEPRTHPIDERA